MNYPIDLTQYELIREIGCTDFSTTYAARCVNNDKMVFIKKIDLEKHPYSMVFLNGEMGFWSEMSFPNMMKYYGSIINRNNLFIFTEYANHGTLLDILQFQYPNGIRDELLISSIIHEILIFLSSFHQKYQIHRSLETRNIFVGQNGSIQIGGFWRARSLIEFGKLKDFRKSSIESSCYTAPELIVENKKYSQSVDIWSLGIIAYELAIGKTPYSDKDPLSQVKSIISDPSPSLPIQKDSQELSTNSVKKTHNLKRSLSADISSDYNFSSAFHSFISICLQKDPMKRPSAADLLKHKFIIQAKGIDYIYSNMVIQLPQLSLRFSLMNKPIEKDNIENENKCKINFNFCGLEDETEINDQPNNEENPHPLNDKALYKSPKFSSNDSLNLEKFKFLDKKMIKSKSHSMINIPNAKYQSHNEEPIKVVKKGRFTISIPISQKQFGSVEEKNS